MTASTAGIKNSSRADVAPLKANGATLRARCFRVGLLGAIVTSLFALSATASSTPDSDWRVKGTWEVHANADDVRAMARDGARIWTATAGGGIARWTTDGQMERQYLSPRDGLTCNDVRDVIRWRETWFFATCDGLVLWEPGPDRMERVTVELPSQRLTALAVDAQDRLWIATEPYWDPTVELRGRQQSGGWKGGGVAVTEDGTTFTAFGLQAGLPSLDIRDIALWRDELWLAARPHQRWRDPSEDPDGGEIPGRFEPFGGGVARWDGTRWHSMDSDTTIELSNDARMLAAGPDALWLATGGRGLVAWQGGRWRGLRDCGNDSRCIQDDFVTSVAVGPGGGVWVATERFNGRGTGVAILDYRETPGNADDDAWFVLRGESAVAGDLVHAILPDTDGSVWFGTSTLNPEGGVLGQGLSRLFADRQTMVHHRHSTSLDGAPAANDITAMARDPLTGDLWLGTARSGLSVLGEDGLWFHHTRSSTGGALASDAIADLEFAPDGTLWVATRQLEYNASTRAWVDGGLSRYRDGGWRRFTTADGLPSNHLSAIALDGRGTLWVGTGATDRGPKELSYRGAGLAAVNANSGQWTRTFTQPQLASNNITGLHVDGGTLWVSTAYFFYVDSRPGGAQFSTGGGLSALDLGSGGWKTYAANEGVPVALRGRDGRPLLDLRSVVGDGLGGAWVGGLRFPDGRFDPSLEPGGFVAHAHPESSSSHAAIDFGQAGPVTALAMDAAGLAWAGTARDGLRVRAPDGAWLVVALPGAPVDTAIGAIERDGDALLIGARGAGLIALRPDGDPQAPGTGGPDPDPTPPHTPTAEAPGLPEGVESVGFVWRSGISIYLPQVKREFVPVLISSGR